MDEYLEDERVRIALCDPSPREVGNGAAKHRRPGGVEKYMREFRSELRAEVDQEAVPLEAGAEKERRMVQLAWQRYRLLGPEDMKRYETMEPVSETFRGPRGRIVSAAAAAAPVVFSDDAMLAEMLVDSSPPAVTPKKKKAPVGTCKPPCGRAWSPWEALPAAASRRPSRRTT